ncbi:Glutamate--tRNA ligase mitochondrial [Pseudocyphellaria aurata]|nr:Glutamate--tRNA ligase mitochondrial [Pseudocyphellaria aurata]
MRVRDGLSLVLYHAYGTQGQILEGILDPIDRHHFTPNEKRTLLTIFQSERTIIYHKHAEELLNSGHAYRCFCSTERLNALARQRNELGLSGEYDRACLHAESSATEKRLSNGEPYVIRLKVPDRFPIFDDIVYGTVGQSNEKRLQRSGYNAYDDSILIKSDGQPTYHLANVVDDHYMEISHVIRAAEWMSSTSKHVSMYRAFGWTPPEFAHVGLLQNSKREKFSKRNDDLDLQNFKKEGIFPEALINYVSLFGWSHKLQNDFLRLQDLINNFSFKFTKGNTIVAPTKLFYLQKQYAAKYVEENGQDLDNMVERVSAVAEENLKSQPGGFDFMHSNLRYRVKLLLRKRATSYTTPQMFFDNHIYLFRPVSRRPLDSKTDHWVLGLLYDRLDAINLQISRVSTEKWTESGIGDVIRKLSNDISTTKPPGTDLAGSKEVQKAINKYLRWAITGGRSGPGNLLIMELLGRGVAMKLLGEAIAECKTFQGQETNLGTGDSSFE